MSFIRIFIQRPVFTTMLFFTLGVIGIVSLINLPYDLIPNITTLEITIVTRFPGASPQIVEQEITKRVEEGIYGIKDVKDIKSLSTEGRSITTVYFYSSVDMKSSLLYLREKMDEISWNFPEGAERPNIVTTGSTSQPIMGIWVRGDRELIKSVVSRRLEQVEGVGAAEMLGMVGTQIVIEVDPELLDEFGISPREIVRQLRAYNITVPLGKVTEGSYTFPLRFVSGTNEVKEVAQIPLQGGVYHLRDVAQIKEVEEEKRSLVLYNGREGYLIKIFKEWKTNSVQVSRKVKDLIKKLNKDYPDLEFVIPYDNAEFIISSIKEILISLILGGILAFLMLFLFTGNRRIPLILAVSMPLSIIPAFFLFYVAGISINTMSLAGLALAIGMLVDSSIVVLENIIRKKDAVTGAAEVGVAVTTGILTTIAVFFPIVYLHGLAGMMLRPLSFAVIATLLISLFVAFSLLPLLARKIKGGAETQIYQTLSGYYNHFLDWIYNNKKMVIVSSFLLMSIGCISFIILRKEVVPPTRSDLIIQYELPFNTCIDETKKIGQRLSQYFTLHRYNVLLSVGETDPLGLMHRGNGELRIGGYKGNIRLGAFFKNYADISYSLKEYNPALAAFSRFGKVSLRVYYLDDDEGDKILRMMKNRLNHAIFPYTEEIPVINIVPKEMILARLGIMPDEFLSRIRMLTSGYKVIDVERGEEPLSIVMKSSKQVNDLKRFRIKGVSLSSLADVTIGYTKRAIIRYNGKRCIEAFVPYKGRISVPEFPFTVELGGEVEEYQRALKSTIIAFAIAVFLVYLILASFYESFLLPLLIIIAVPFAVAGFLISLLATWTSLNVISLIGLVVLVGIVVNDSILLVDKAEKLKREGTRLPGKRAARERLRPIVMTTLTTVFGLLPFSIGNTLHAPMGRGVIGGLLLSTFITLVLIPIIYDRFFS